MKKVLVIGSLNVDLVVQVDHIPVGGETILAKEELRLVPGGKGANQACALGRLGVPTAMLGAVGEDSYAAIELGSLRSADVDVSCVIQRAGVSTGMAMIPVSAAGENCIVVIPGANGTMTPADIDANRALLEASDAVVVQLEIPLDTVVYAAKLAKELGKLVILDPAPAPKEFPAELYRYVDIVKPNETELAILTGSKAETCVQEAARWLRGQGVQNVVVTLGGDGVYVDSEAEGQFHIPARKVVPVDTTAAGDAFTAALAAKLLEGKGLREAAAFANAVSAIVVTRRGAQSSIPSLAEVEALVVQG